MNGLMKMFVDQAMQSKDPRAAKAIQLIQNGDIKGQEEMARNLCQSIGITPEQAMEQIQQKMQRGFPFVNK